MSPRSRSEAHDPAAQWEALRKVAIVGAASLKGGELKDALEERKFPTVDVKLLDDDESLGRIDAVGDEATFVLSTLPDSFHGVDFAFFACEPEFTRKHWQSARDAGATIIDLSYGLEAEAGAALRAPWVEKELAADGVLSGDSSARLQVVAHPAAIVLAVLLIRAQRAGRLRVAVANVFEPASERGRRGMDELHQQTVNLLSFQPLPKSVFDAQVAFNMLSRYGPEARPLEPVEQRVLRHFAGIMRPIGPAAPTPVPVPLLMLLQAPTFHSYAVSLYIEFEKGPGLDAVVEALAGERVSVTQGAEDTPSNVSAAGQSEIQVRVRSDAQREPGFWLWAVADNLKVAGLNAVECAETSTLLQPIQ